MKTGSPPEVEKMKPWFLYLVRCADGSIYTGASTDVARRLDQHRSGRGSRYLRGRGPLVLVRKFRVGDRGEALKAERRVKRLPRARKEDLIRGRIRLKDLLKVPSRRKRALVDEQKG
jgi:putative endonuclease